jgi:hypothetical protein
MPSVDEALNVAFFAIHSSWIVYTCTGWAWKRTRKWHLAAVALTGFSWFGLGIAYGWGYCPCTDWHWAVRSRLGYHDPPSYTQLLLKEVFGTDPGAAVANALTVGVLAVSATLSVVLSLRDRRRAGAVLDRPYGAA